MVIRVPGRNAVPVNVNVVLPVAVVGATRNVGRVAAAADIAATTATAATMHIMIFARDTIVDGR